MALYVVFFILIWREIAPSYMYFVLLGQHSQYYRKTWMVIIYVQFAVTNDLSLVHLEQTCLETVFGSTQLEFTVHQWWLCHISGHIGLALSSTDLYLFNFVFRSWPSDTRVWLMHCFLTQASLLYHLLSRLYQRCYYSNFTPNFTGIRVIFVSSLQHVKWLLLSVCILGVLLTLAMLLMPLLWCSCRYKHLVSTLVAHQMVVKTTQLLPSCTCQENLAPHYICWQFHWSMVSFQHQLKRLCYCHKDHCSRLCYSALGMWWQIFTERFDKSSKRYAHIKNSGRSISSK